MSETGKSDFHEFPTTHWSLIGRVGGSDHEASRRALNQLLSHYIPPMRAHLRFVRRLDYDTAEEILQNFLTDRVLENNLLALANESRGRFRNFLRTALNNFASNYKRSQSAGVRSPDRAISLPPGEEPLRPRDAR